MLFGEALGHRLAAMGAKLSAAPVGACAERRLPICSSLCSRGRSAWAGPERICKFSWSKQA